MSYTELESGYQDLRQQSSQQAAAVSSQTHASVVGNTGGVGVSVERTHQRPGFFVGHDGNFLSTEKVERVEDNPVVTIMGNRFEKLVSAAGGDDNDNWSRYLKKGNPHKYCHHNHMQCQICKKHQQQCHTCSTFGGADNNLALLHVSSTPNLGETTLPTAPPLDLRSSSFSYGRCSVGFGRARTFL